jgi:hypothetical protein
MSTNYQSNLPTHVNVLGWMYIIGNILFVILGVMFYFLLRGIGIVTDDFTAMRILTVVGIFFMVILTALGIPGILAGIGLLQRKQWGRILSLVVGFFGLLNVPLGTILGIYTFIVLLPTEASEYFE